MATVEVPVLIVGGGPIGLSSALGLTRQGVDWLLLERRTSRSTVQPRARGIKVRTMEIFRAWGVERAVAAAGLPAEKSRYMLWVTTLAGEELRRVARPSMDGAAGEQSPTDGCTCPQDAFEPILLDHALATGTGRARFGHELVALDQDASEVRATIVDRATDERTVVHARYLVAADGQQSRIRETLGIPLMGPGTLAHYARIIFHADLSRLVAGRESVVYWIQNPSLRANLLPINQSDRWELSLPYDPTRGEAIADYTVERCTEIARQAIGLPDLPVQILDVSSYPMAAGVAERFRAGRVFLAGDAAHVMPARGAYGMNTGIQDAHNLAWKLAAVLRGWGDPSLLDTYEVERQPVGAYNTEQALRNEQSVAPAAGQGASAPNAAPRGRAEMFSDQGMFLGYCYTSAAVIPDGTDVPVVANPVSDYVPTAHPGARAPHIWLERAGERISTLDLFDTAFVLLVGPAGRAWAAGAMDSAEALGVPLRVDVVGAGGDLVDTNGSWPDRYGIESTGAVLVRPDGHVAWRSRSGCDAPQSVLRGALRILSGRGSSVRTEGPDH